MKKVGKQNSWKMNSFAQGAIIIQRNSQKKEEKRKRMKIIKMKSEQKVSRSPKVEGSVYKLDISTLAKAEAKEREHSNYPH